MKKAFFVIVIFTSCYASAISQPLLKEANNDSLLKKAFNVSPPTDDCDYYADYYESQAMISYFNDHFRPGSIQTDFVIEKEVLTAIKSFLDSPTHENYDGIRFFLGVKKKWFLGKYKPTFFLVPTIKNASPTTTEKHTNIWGNIINFSGFESLDLSLNAENKSANDEIDKFGEKFRGEQEKGKRESAPDADIAHRSVGIWIAKCKIDTIVKVLNANNELAGIKALAASYFKPDTRRYERSYIDQTTFIFVPVKANGVLDWSLIPKPPIGWIKDAGLNHGALCPQICN